MHTKNSDILVWRKPGCASFSTQRGHRAARSTMATLDEQDRRFLGRLESSIATVQAWDADPSLLAECRALIPLQEVSENYTRDDDVLHSGNALFLKHLALFFKERVMTWVNNPPCTKCGSADTESREMRGPETAEEQEGGASRVEGKPRDLSLPYLWRLLWH